MLCLTVSFFGAKSEEITTAVADSLTQEIGVMLQEEGLSSLKDFSALSTHQVNALIEMYKIKNNVSISAPVDFNMLIPLSFFIFCAGVLFIVIFYNWKDKKRRYELLEKAIEKGVEIPHNMLIKPQKDKKEKHFFYYLKNGIFLAGIALSLIFLNVCLPYRESSVFMIGGVILGGIALAFLVIAFFERASAKNRKSENENI